MIETPALEALAQSSRDTWPLMWGVQIEIPGECHACPFARAMIDASHDAPNPADPGEGYYTCDLLHRKEIWGENPQCSEADWHQQIQIELYALRALVEPRSEPS